MSSIRFSCENCHQTIKADRRQAGSKGRCPGCKKPLLVPFETSLRPLSDEFPLAALSLGDEIDLESVDARKESEPKRAPARLALEPVAIEPPNEPTQLSNARFSGLRAMSVAFRVLAGIALIQLVFSSAAIALGLDASTGGSATKTLLSLEFAGHVVVGGATVCGLMTVSELISVALELQENIALLARRSRQNR